MSFYKQLPDKIDLKTLKHIALDYVPKHASRICNQTLKIGGLPPVSGFDKEIKHLNKSIVSHMGYINRPANRIPGYSRAKMTLLSAVAESIVNNRETIDGLLMQAFGTSDIIMKDDLTLQQLFIIDWLMMINLYALSILELPIRLSAMLSQPETRLYQNGLKFLNTTLFFITAIRGNLRETLMINNFYEHMTELSTNAVVPSMLSTQFESTFSGDITASVPNNNRVMLFSIGDVRVLPLDLERFEKIPETLDSFITFYPTYRSALSSGDASLQPLSRMIDKINQKLSSTIRRIGYINARF